jgi:hypothetical protein
MQSAFLDGGGDVKLVMLDADQRFDGHAIFAQAAGRVKWLPQMDAFLRFLKLPTWTRDDVTALMTKLGVKETSRGFVETYVAAPPEKALARQKAGTFMGEAHGVIGRRRAQIGDRVLRARQGALRDSHGERSLARSGAVTQL